MCGQARMTQKNEPDVSVPGASINTSVDTRNKKQFAIGDGDAEVTAPSTPPHLPLTASSYD